MPNPMIIKRPFENECFRAKAYIITTVSSPPITESTDVTKLLDCKTTILNNALATSEMG